MSRNDDYTLGNLLDYLYQKYKLIGIDLSRQANTSTSQHINFVGKLEEDNDATIFLDPQPRQDGSYKIASVRPSFRLSISFLVIGSLVFFGNLAWY